MRIPKIITLCLLGVSVFSTFLIAQNNQKLKAEEIISKYLDAVGPADKRAAVKTRVTYGAAQITYIVGANGSMEGRGNIISQGRASRLAFLFSAQDYPGEQIAFDGSKISAKDLPRSPGNYSPLSRFILDNDAFFKDGLLFGPLSTASLLLDVAGRKAKVDSNGIKKIDGRQLYELKYAGRSGIQTSFYFDPETFRHVRSIFKFTRTNPAAGGQDFQYQIDELFDDFKPVDGLMLPHSYQIEYSLEQRFLIQWKHKIEKIAHNEALEADVFAVK